MTSRPRLPIIGTGLGLGRKYVLTIVNVLGSVPYKGGIY